MLTGNQFRILHKTSTSIARENQIVVVEDLGVRNMVKNRKLSKAISDVGWGMFREFLNYKLDRKGGCLVKINKFFPSSQVCNNYGTKNPEVKNLSVREWVCSTCKTEHDRDFNASINILKEGIRILPEYLEKKKEGKSKPQRNFFKKKKVA